jgi:serpin B
MRRGGPNTSNGTFAAQGSLLFQGAAVMKRAAVLLCLVLLPAVPATAAGPSDPGVPPDVRTLVQGNNAFALDLLARLREKDGNVFYSPYSISTALAMTSAGARGETAEQMARVLHFTLDRQRLHPAFAELIRGLNGHGLPRDYRLDVAQSLWGDRTLIVRPEFQDLLYADYGARLRVVNFGKEPDVARRQINRWVEDRTNDKIKDLLHQGDIEPITRMVLVNAIYFKAAWQKPFEAEATKEAVFHSGGKEVTVPLMHQTEEFNYYEDDGFQAVELPYEGGELSLVALLPRQKDGLGKLEQSLTAAKLDACLGKLSPWPVEVFLPRFKTNARLALARQLAAMGMPLAFSPAADFSGISTTQKLTISEVIHQTFVDVNEGGTEAAAATAVILRAVSAPKPVAFRADHPFLFLLRDRRTGSILFLGRVTHPSGGARTGKG